MQVNAKEEKSSISKALSAITRLVSRREFVLILRLFIGALFIYAAYDKILRPDQFAVSVRSYKIIPVGFSNLFALTVAWSEMVAGVLLLLGVLARQAASTIFILLLMFIVAITTTLVRGLMIDCGCFKAGESGHLIDSGLLIRDILLLIATYIVIAYDRGFLGLGRIFSRT